MVPTTVQALQSPELYIKPEQNISTSSQSNYLGLLTLRQGPLTCFLGQVLSSSAIPTGTPAATVTRQVRRYCITDDTFQPRDSVHQTAQGSLNPAPT